jgi:uncharacterized protein YfdQ (DUF2303 family)
MDPVKSNTDVGDALQFAKESYQPKLVTGTDFAQDNLGLLVMPQGMKIEDAKPYLDKLRDKPRRIETKALMLSVDSLIDYTNNFKSAGTRLFLTPSDHGRNARLMTVLDFHEATSEPRFGAHRAIYTFQPSDRLKAWSDASEGGMNNMDFAAFMQERRFDLVNPPVDWMLVQGDTLTRMLWILNLADDIGTIDDDTEEGEDADRLIPRSALYKLRKIRFGSAQRLLQMSRTIEISVNAKSTEGYDDNTGERVVNFQEEHETKDRAGRKIKVPEMFLIRIPIFQNESEIILPVRLQYRRKAGGPIEWYLTLFEWRRVLDNATLNEAQRAATATTCPLTLGWPEGAS